MLIRLTEPSHEELASGVPIAGGEWGPYLLEVRPGGPRA